MKLDFVLFCYKKLDRSIAEENGINVREKFEKLYGKYLSNFNKPNASESQLAIESCMLDKSSGEGSRSTRSKVFMVFKVYQSETKPKIGKSELDLYLEEKILDYDDNEDLDVLNYWKTNEKRFPTLASMARDVLSISITTVVSEYAFSIGGRVLTKYRSSTLPENVQMLICTRDWLHGFVLNTNDEDDCQPICYGTIGAESNVHQEDEIEDLC